MGVSGCLSIWGEGRRTNVFAGTWHFVGFSVGFSLFRSESFSPNNVENYREELCVYDPPMFLFYFSVWYLELTMLNLLKVIGRCEFRSYVFGINYQRIC